MRFTPSLFQSSARTEPLAARAASDLKFIRTAMQCSGRFTAVPGWGAVFMGSVALVATGFALGQDSAQAWLAVWLSAAGIAGPVGAWALAQKARAQGISLASGLGRKFLLGLCPGLIAGCALTWVLWNAGRIDLLPVTWLLVYGASITAAGALSIPVVPLMGSGFLALGILAVLVPLSWGSALLAIGFGGLHIAFGYWVAKHHGG